MNADSEAAVIQNDLDSLVHRIEALPGHPEYTEAVLAVQKARDAVNAGRTALHHAGMRARFAAAT
jgi:hypothetical protein